MNLIVPFFFFIIIDDYDDIYLAPIFHLAQYFELKIRRFSYRSRVSAREWLVGSSRRFQLDHSGNLRN